MSIPLIKILGEAIEESARYYLISYIKYRYTGYIKENKIKVDELPPTALWRFRAGEKYPISYLLYGIDHMYLYKLRGNFKNLTDQESTIYYSEFHLKNIFECFGYQETEEKFIPFLIRYIKSIDIPWHLKSHQVEEIRREYPNVDKAFEVSDLIDADNMVGFKHRLAGEKEAKWFLYFYGYEVTNHPKNHNKTWPLVRLVISFKHKKGDKNLPVHITNTEHRHHFDYKGSTDLDSSTNRVLVLNLKTVEEEPKRQLNIKILMNGAWGSLFLGQYLNYEVAKGRIISGDLILEQAKEDEPVPLTYKIKDPLEDTDGYETIKHLNLLIPRLKSGFRETSPAVFVSSELGWNFSDLP